jgi:hypothetical protein
MTDTSLVVHPPLRVQPGSKQSLPVLFMFMASTGIVAMTGNLFIAGLWLAMWYVAAHGAGAGRAGGYMAFFLGICFLYPTISIDYSNLHQKNVVLGGALLFFYFMRRKDIDLAAREFKMVSILAKTWVGWGLLAYVPVLLASVGKYMLRVPLPAYLDDIANENSLLKTTLYMLPNALTLYLPILCLKQSQDLREFIRVVYVFAITVIAGAFAIYYFGFNPVHEDYSEVYSFSYRMGTFSMPDANGFGRLLLMPMLLFISLSLRKFRLSWSLLVFFGMICIVLTYSRTTYSSIVVGILMAVLANALRVGGLVKAILICLVIVTLVQVLELPDMIATDRRLSSLYNWESRLRLHEMVAQVVLDKPLFGAHPGGYARQIVAMGYSSRAEIYSPHNMFLGIAVEWGVPMAAILGVALIAAIRNGIVALARLRQFSALENQSLKAMAVLCIALPVNYLVHGFAEIIPPEFIFFIAGVSFALLHMIGKECGGKQ